MVLDHGLKMSETRLGLLKNTSARPCVPCRQLDDDFRLQYARMWQALVMADEAAIRSAAAGMGAGDTTELFAGVLTQRPWSQVRGFAERLSARVSRFLLRWGLYVEITP